MNAVHIDVVCPACGKPGRLCTQRDPKYPFVTHYETELIRDGGQTFEWHHSIGECFVPVDFAREAAALAAGGAQEGQG